MKRLAVLMILIAGLGSSALAGQPPITPETLVGQIYAEDGAVIESAKLPRYYSRDLAPALARDQRSEGVGAIGFDWLWSAQDMEITDLSFVEVATGPGGAVVEARFGNFGQPTVVIWELCRRPDGQYRVVDVRGGGDETWSLRALLDLPETPKC